MVDVERAEYSGAVVQDRPQSVRPFVAQVDGMYLVSRFLLTTAILVALAAPGAAQTADRVGHGTQSSLPGGRPGPVGEIPPRDNGQFVADTAKISGRIVAAETGSPLRRAQVNIDLLDGQSSRMVITDNDGRYELTALRAGRYRLFVNKEGYVALEYGQVRPFEAGKPLDVAAGQVLENVDFSLPRGSAITGRIIDEFGDPLVRVEVQAMRHQHVNGGRELAAVGEMAQTDDLGAYRIFGLMPGDYLVRASMRDIPIARITEPDQPTYRTAYYPGVIDVAQAETVTVTLGQEIDSVGFRVAPARLSRISGTVASSDGRPLFGALVTIRARGDGIGPPIQGSRGDNQVRPDGSFQLMNVPPGEYILDVQQHHTSNQPHMPPAQLEFASIPISVSGDGSCLSNGGKV